MCTMAAHKYQGVVQVFTGPNPHIFTCGGPVLQQIVNF